MPVVQPSDLARIVEQTLREQQRPVPNAGVLDEIFETMYSASLRTEEGQTIVFHIVYTDPENPDPDPPGRIRTDRWRPAFLSQRVPFRVADLTKLATASDPRTSSLAVFHDDEIGLHVWGLVDQGNEYYDYINYESESVYAHRPGTFQASIEGIATISAWIDRNKVAELRGTELLAPPSDPLAQGPIRDALSAGIQEFLSEVKSETSEDQYNDRPEWDSLLTESWIASLCRLLLRSRNYRHGGAVLLTPDTSGAHLNVKFQLPYNRIRTSLTKVARYRIDATYASDLIHDGYLEDEEARMMPVLLYLNNAVAENEREDAQRALDGALWFVSLLTRVDGLVLLGPNLDVRGFGVEITAGQEPTSIFLAGDARGTKKRQTPLDYTQYGTRHRSMMRYCAEVPGSVGFVISQDGDVRAVTCVGERLMLWENVKVQKYETDTEHPPRIERPLQN
jgi:hypothetical protein